MKKFKVFIEYEVTFHEDLSQDTIEDHMTPSCCEYLSDPGIKEIIFKKVHVKKSKEK